MTNFAILDCTFRDGGYYTDWDFDEDLTDVYLSNVARLPVQMIEIGYCSHPLPGYKGEWFYLGLERLRNIKSRLREDQSLCVMLDAKDCAPERIEELLGDLVGTVDMVRMAVAPNQFDHGIALARELKRLGFKVGFNTMYLSTYSDDLSALDPLKAGEDVIDILALVDSFGGCTPSQVSRHIATAKTMFPTTPIGFHGHDNTCLGYANAVAAIEAGAAVIDATFVGMGRGAGNTRTEMLIVQKSANGEDVDFDAVAQIVERFELLRDVYKWGSNLPYMLSGASNLPQKDVMDWLGKNRYSPVSVVRALKKQSNAALDEQSFPVLRSNLLSQDDCESVLIVGGGASVERHAHAIRSFIASKQCCVIHASTRHLDLAKDFDKQIICLPGHAATRLSASNDFDKIAGFVVPPPPRFVGTLPEGVERPVFQAQPFPSGGGENLGPVSDIGPLALALGAAKALSARRIYLVGFDGYGNATIAEQELSGEIQRALDALRASDDNLEIFSLTPTLYSMPKRSIYAEAAA